MADIIREELLLVGVDNSKYEEVKAFVDLIFAKLPGVPTQDEINYKATGNRQLLTGRNDLFSVPAKKNIGFKAPTFLHAPSVNAEPSPQALRMSTRLRRSPSCACKHC